jgi:hypothetical protein
MVASSLSCRKPVNRKDPSFPFADKNQMPTLLAENNNKQAQPSDESRSPKERNVQRENASKNCKG